MSDPLCRKNSARLGASSTTNRESLMLGSKSQIPVLFFCFKFYITTQKSLYHYTVNLLDCLSSEQSFWWPTTADCYSDRITNWMTAALHRRNRVCNVVLPETGDSLVHVQNSQGQERKEGPLAFPSRWGWETPPFYSVFLEWMSARTERSSSRHCSCSVLFWYGKEKTCLLTRRTRNLTWVQFLKAVFKVEFFSVLETFFPTKLHKSSSFW